MKDERLALAVSRRLREAPVYLPETPPVQFVDPVLWLTKLNLYNARGLYLYVFVVGLLLSHLCYCWSLDNNWRKRHREELEKQYAALAIWTRSQVLQEKLDAALDEAKQGAAVSNAANIANIEELQLQLAE